MTKYFERLEDESSRAYAAFRCFRDLGPSRSLKQAAGMYYGKTTGNLRQVETWSSKFNWVERATNYDDFLETTGRSAVEEYVRSTATDRVEREAAHRKLTFENEERAAKLEEDLLDRYERLLRVLPLIQREVTRVEDGVPVTYVIKPATPAPDLSAKRLHEIAARSLPSKVEMDASVRHRGLSEKQKAELDRLRDDPESGKFFRRLFDEE